MVGKTPYTPYIQLVFTMVYPLLKGSNRGLKQLGIPPKGTSMFPMIHDFLQPVPWKLLQQMKINCPEISHSSGYMAAHFVTTIHF